MSFLDTRVYVCDKCFFNINAECESLFIKENIPDTSIPLPLDNRGTSDKSRRMISNSCVETEENRESMTSPSAFCDICNLREQQTGDTEHTVRSFSRDR